MSGIELSPAKHKAASARLRKERQQNARRGHVRMEIEKRKPRVAIVAADSFEWEAKGGKVIHVESTWNPPTRYPRPNFSRGKGGIG